MLGGIMGKVPAEGFAVDVPGLAKQGDQGYAVELAVLPWLAPDGQIANFAAGRL